jgi:thiol:disulfide interchange protein
MQRKTALVLVLALSIVSAVVQESPVTWSAKGPEKAVKPGEAFAVKLDAVIDGNWHLYSTTTPAGGPNPTRLTLLPGSPFELAGPPRQSPPTTEADPNFGIDTEFFTRGAEFWLPVKVPATASPGDYEATFQAMYQVCNDQLCLPPTRVPIKVKIRVAGVAASHDRMVAASAASAKPAVQPEPAAQTPAPENPGANPAAVLQLAPAPVAAASEPLALSGTAAEVAQARSSGFWPFLWLAMTMGALSLAAPCVFPMIPITVSYFTKNAEKRRGSGVSHALVYCGGIIFTFTGLGLGLAALLGATGINQFAANPWVNLLITAVFLGFALNLFGLYQIGVPSGILTRLSNAAGGSGYVSALLMGLTFTLTSFTCTVPFVGTVLVATAQGDWLWPALGMLGFSLVFSAPFFALALVPQWLRSMPKSGGWLNSVKVTMGFLEVAAAMKFISNVDLVWNWHFFTREVVLAIWIAIAVLATVYLLGKFRLPHDSPAETIGVARMTWAMLFLSLGFYLFTGLIGGSLGELDAFLPPRTAGELTLTGAGGYGQELTWNTTLTAALAEAKQKERPIFIDFTGYTCTNCRWMESNLFPLPAVRAELDKYVRLQLYTDGEGKQYEENQKYQKEQFGTVALPLYAILDRNGNKVATFPGMTRKSDEFLRFLRSPFVQVP